MLLIWLFIITEYMDCVTIMYTVMALGCSSSGGFVRDIFDCYYLSISHFTHYYEGFKL